jgi:hypothetical protein
MLFVGLSIEDFNLDGYLHFRNYFFRGERERIVCSFFLF